MEDAAAAGFALDNDAFALTADVDARESTGDCEAALSLFLDARSTQQERIRKIESDMAAIGTRWLW